jgi:hypothetical protein
MAMNLEEQLREAFAPCEPGPAAEAAVMAYVFGGAKRTPRGKPTRRILFGTILVVAAAAAMLLVHVGQSPAPVAALVDPPDPVVATVAETAAPPGLVVEPQLAEAVAPEQTAAPVLSFTVQVMPLENTATEPSASAAIRTVYATFVEQLRTVPGLVLLQADRSEGASQAPPDFQLTLRGVDSGKVGSFAGEIQADALNPAGTLRRRSYLSYSGDVAPPCASASPINAEDTDATDCMDPRGAGASLVRLLRTMAFPPDPSLRRSLQARLANRSMDAGLRLRALSDLAQFGLVQSAIGSTSPYKELRDPAVVHAAIDLATTAADPLQRARAWALLRGVDNAELTGPLLMALGQDRDGDVRLAALGTLIAGFREEERVQAALAVAAQRDARPLVRALAQRALGGVAGEDTWRDYLIVSLKDGRRSGLERIEALFYQLGMPFSVASGIGPQPNPRGTLQLLDGEAIQALGEALSEAADKSPIVRNSSTGLAMQLAQLDDPAVTDLLLASLDSGGWPDRATAAYALGQQPSRRNDSRVRAVLEKISANDPDPRVRQNAMTSLQKPAEVQAPAVPVPATASVTDVVQSPRLGIGMIAVRGQHAPKELVGKPMVATVQAGSVAQKAGMQFADVLLEINGTQIPSPEAVPGIVATIPTGVDVDLLVNRYLENVTLKARF